jgi:Cu+-exporting ATPase
MHERVVTRRQEMIIEINGMTRGDCERRVAEAISAVPGVFGVKASYAEGHVVVSADTERATMEKLRAAIAAAGCEPGEVRLPE